MRFNYQSIGSGGGIRQIAERTVDFGATDGPMTDEQLKKAPGELLHIPTVLGAVVATYNLPGSPKLRFTRAGPRRHLPRARSRSGTTTALEDAEPAVQLPDQSIVVVHRSDGSGTTYIWVDYLSKVSKEWEQKTGRGTSVSWPVGLGGKGNEGVAGLVKSTPGALGYVELAYATTNKLPVGAVQNQAGKFVEPTIESTTAAAAGAATSMPADFRVSLTNAPGADAYPIASFTWLLVYKDQQNEAKGRALVKFLWWAVHQGQQYPAVAPLRAAARAGGEADRGQDQADHLLGQAAPGRAGSAWRCSSAPGVASPLASGRRPPSRGPGRGLGDRVFVGPRPRRRSGWSCSSPPGSWPPSCGSRGTRIARVRLAFSLDVALGSRRRRVRRVPVHLRHAGLVAPGAPDRGAALPRRRHLPRRARAVLDPSARSRS